MVSATAGERAAHDQFQELLIRERKGQYLWRASPKHRPEHRPENQAATQVAVDPGAVT